MSRLSLGRYSPAPNRFVRDVDASFEQHLLDLPQAQIEPDVQPDRVAMIEGRNRCRL